MLNTKTIETYKYCLERIKGYGFDIDNINVDKLKEYMNDKKIPLTSQNACISALGWHIKSANGKKELIDELTKFNSELRNKISNRYDQNELSDREEKNYVPWLTIELIYKDMENRILVENSKRLDEDYLILSYYYHHPPRRLEYHNIYLSDEKVDETSKLILDASKKISGNWFELTNEERQTIIKGQNYSNQNKYCNGYFIFDDYKTRKTYGRQIVKVTDKLKETINRHILKYEIKNGEKLLNLSHDNFRKRIQCIFKDYVGKSASIDIIRHSYISHKLSDPKITMSERKCIGLLMGHSIGTQDIYKKICPETEECKMQPKKTRKSYNNVNK